MARTPINQPKAKGPRKSVVILGLLTVLGGGAYRFIKSPPRTSAIASAPASTVPEVATPGYKANLPDLEINWAGGMKRDIFDTRDLTPKIADLIPQTQPTAPDARQLVAAEAKNKIRLQATLGGENPTALINGNTYNAGDRVNGFAIVSILDNQIIVERQGVRLSITSE